MFDTSRIGHSFPPFTVEIERTKIREWSLTIGATFLPALHDLLIVRIKDGSLFRTSGQQQALAHA